MISLQNQFLGKSIVIAIISIACFQRLGAQSTLLEVESTPYDHQMERVQPTLTAPTGYTFDELSMSLVNEWMIELRAMPYRYSREWRTPEEVEGAKAADCKGKAITIYDRLQLNGATNVRFIIGKRRVSDLMTHAWVEWQPGAITYILDPTFSWVAAIKGTDRSRYVAFYAYEGPHKYLIGDPAFVSRSLGRRIPVAPSQGAITRPVKSTPRFRNDQTNPSEIPFELRMFANRAAFSN